MSDKPAIEEQFATIIELAANSGIRPVVVVLAALSLNHRVQVQADQGFFTTAYCLLTLKLTDPEQEWCREISRTHQVVDENKLRSIIIHDFTSFLPDHKRSAFGKYYTPDLLTALVHQATKDLDISTLLIIDIAAGCGAFLKEYNSANIRGFDIDEEAVLILKALGFNGEQLNSLEQPGRDWFKIDSKVKLVLIGNPPYNDVTSKNKRTGKNAKTSTQLLIHQDLKASDLGRSFLKQAFAMAPVRIVFLHPFSYVCKRKNLKELCGFNYRIAGGTLFSSSLFPGTSTPFPCICAVWEPCNPITSFATEVERIRQLKFDLFEGGTFCLADYNEFSITDLPKYASPEISDCGVYHYNFRDLNSLLTSANFINQPSPSSFPVQWEQLPTICLANVIKRRWRSVPHKLDYIAGNLNVPRCPMLEASPALLIADAFLNSPVLQANQELKSRLNERFILAARNLETWATLWFDNKLDECKILVAKLVVAKMEADKNSLFK